MSGGSYDYLSDQPIGELGSPQYLAHLDNMAETLDEAGARSAAARTREIAAALRCEEVDRSLRDVWHAVEWAESGDFGWDQVSKALIKYETGEG